MKDTLVCKIDCAIPSLGQFSVGDIITDEITVVLLKDHPYFAPQVRRTTDTTPRKEK